MTTPFERKKASILQQLSLPIETYDDLSPKGSIDAQISDFVSEINSYDGLVTTSSCSGRISVFLEGKSKDVNGEDLSMLRGDVNMDEGESVKDVVSAAATSASMGGKGGGGRWLFVSHERVDVPLTSKPREYDGVKYNDSSFTKLFQLQNLAQVQLSQASVALTSERRFIHFKFEPMILHILASDATTAHNVLTSALQSGFRESGATNIPSASKAIPIALAVRTTGLAFDNIIGYSGKSCDGEDVLIPLVPESYLRLLVELANSKFTINKERIARFRGLVARNFGEKGGINGGKETVWEDTAVRRKRKKAEGLKRREELWGRINSEDERSRPDGEIA